MLTDERCELIRQVIKELEESSQAEKSVSEIYFPSSLTAICKAEALFGDEVPKIKPYARESVEYTSRARRNACVVAGLLEEYLIRCDKKGKTSNDVLNKLKPYRGAYRHYANGLAKYHDGIYERNTLDDMRAALESLIREITGKEKTLENQVSIICTMLDDHGVKPEIRNLFQKTLDYFTKYQNNYVKHNDEVEPAEVSFVIEWTGVLMKYIINMLG